MVHRVLSPYRQPLRFDPDKLNLHFASTAKRTLGVESTSVEEFFQLIRDLSDIYEDAFNFKNVTHREVLNTLKQTKDGLFDRTRSAAGSVRKTGCRTLGWSYHSYHQ